VLTADLADEKTEGLPKRTKGTSRQVNRIRVENMSKSSFLALLWLATSTAVAVTAGISSAPVNTSTANRVIAPNTDYPKDRVPVISDIALDSRQGLLASVGDDHMVCLWNARDGKLLRRLTGHADWIHGVVFWPSGDQLATGGDDRQILVWNSNQEEPRDAWTTGDVAIAALAINPDGTMVASAGFGDKVRIHDGDTGRLLHVLDGPGDDLRALAFSADGAHLAAAGRSGRIRVWRTADAEALHDLVGHRRRVRALAYSPDGARLASAGEERHLRLWDARTGQPQEIIDRAPGKALALAFCGPARLAVGGTDNAVRVWDISRGEEIVRLVGHTGSVTCLAWNPEHEELFSGSFDTTVRVWSLPGGKAETAARAKKHVTTEIH